MIEQQKMIAVSVPELAQFVKGMKEGGYRLVQIGATTTAGGFEVNYSFDREYNFVNARVTLAAASAALPSVSQIYWNAFLYENEIQDLFGITIAGMAVDYRGQLYKTAVKVPFGTAKKQEKGSESNG
jgi:ech hydrogenase subunit D